jgi:hypothetical protein
MNSRLTDVLEGKEENYILPLFWLHGEEENVLREEMARVDEAGIKAVCVEARPHPDYLGPGWWRDMDIVMEEAKARGMRVWVLDDDHFPTGHAAGRLKDAPQELRRLFLTEKHIDAIGPRANASFLVSPAPSLPFFAIDGGGTLVGVVAVKRDSVTGELTEEAIELTSLVQEGTLYWDVPKGFWRIFSLIETDKGGSEAENDYLNPLVPASVRVLIDTVYEAFYDHYRDDFGHTLAGFFSDESGFYNDKETFDFNSTLGKPKVPLPWSQEVSELLKRELGLDYMRYMPMLWHSSGDQTMVVRYHYMDIVSKLYAKHFAGQIGDWCRARNVEYIGHVLEDNNVHARLGCGAGHFFRSLWGQDMAGIDVVLWQLAPGFDEVPFTWFAGETDSEFFNYGMAKMAASLAHLDPKKKGRTMVELFGAYGWAEGLKLMKWLTDHMLVRGVNYFVPHAFSAKEFPDPDCPPHFYARGKNPQFRYYRYLNQYTNRMSHLLSGGKHIASAAVLYHAEAEWSGNYMYFHKPVKELVRSQIDCDILPCEALLENAFVQDGKLCSHDEWFDCLIIPYSEALPAGLLARFDEFVDQGLEIVFVESMPIRSSEGTDVSAFLNRLAAHEKVKIVPLHDLANHLKESGMYEIEVRSSQPYLRYYHIRHTDLDVYMFFNEHPMQHINTEVLIPVTGRVVCYDAYHNKTVEAGRPEDDKSTSLQLTLAPFESITVLAGKGIEDVEALPGRGLATGEDIAISGPWLVATATSEQYPKFTEWKELESLTDLSRPGLLPNFSGTFRYETQFEWKKSAKVVSIELGEVYETAEVFVNGVSGGVCLSFPYELELNGLLRQDTNTLAIEVTNTLVKEQPDFLSRITQQEPSGLIGPVRFIVG